MIRERDSCIIISVTYMIAKGKEWILLIADSE